MIYNCCYLDVGLLVLGQASPSSSFVPFTIFLPRIESSITCETRDMVDDWDPGEGLGADILPGIPPKGLEFWNPTCGPGPLAERLFSISDAIRSWIVRPLEEFEKADGSAIFLFGESLEFIGWSFLLWRWLCEWAWMLLPPREGRARGGLIS